MVTVLLLVQGCQQNNQVAKPQTYYAPQPIEFFQQDYPLICNRSLPIRPLCTAHMGGSLDQMMGAQLRKQSFEACKRDVENFVKAVEFQSNCFKKDLKSYVNNLMQEAQERLSCEYSSIDQINNGMKPNDCPDIVVPAPSEILTHDDYRYFGGIEAVLTLPHSCKFIEEWYSVSERQNCVDELNCFLDFEAQFYYDKQIEIYFEGDTYPDRDGVTSYVNNVIKQFNCKASGQSICLSF